MEENVSNDLKALSELEIPPKSDPIGRNIVKWTVLLVCITVLGALIIVTYALLQSYDEKKDIREQLSCVRSSTVLVDKTFANGMIVLIDNDNTILAALQAVSVNDQAHLTELLASFTDRVAEGEASKTDLIRSIEVREDALDRC
jgi:hypothetical protein